LATCFGSSETFSGQFLTYRHGAFSECAHYGIPYCLQTIFILRSKLKSFGRCIFGNMFENSYQYISKSLLKFYASLYILRVKLKLLSNGRITGVTCLCTYLKPILLLIWSILSSEGCFITSMCVYIYIYIYIFHRTAGMYL